jgi:hypothetical protein
LASAVNTCASFHRPRLPGPPYLATLAKRSWRAARWTVKAFRTRSRSKRCDQTFALRRALVGPCCKHLSHFSRAQASLTVLRDESCRQDSTRHTLDGKGVESGPGQPASARLVVTLLPRSGGRLGSISGIRLTFQALRVLTSAILTRVGFGTRRPGVRGPKAAVGLVRGQEGEIFPQRAPKKELRLQMCAVSARRYLRLWARLSSPPSQLLTQTDLATTLVALHHQGHQNARSHRRRLCPFGPARCEMSYRGCAGRNGSFWLRKKDAGRLLPLANRAEGPCAYVGDVCLDGGCEARADSGRQNICVRTLNW